MSFARYTAAALLPAAVLGSGLVIPDDNRMVQQDGLIRYPVIPQQGGPLFGKSTNFTKRQIGSDSLTQRSGTLYTIELTLGTPGQKVPVQFDTGSSELWVNPVCSKSTTPDFCNAQPRFTQSSTLTDLGVAGSVQYGTGYADFEYVSDYVSIGSAKITQQIFGVAYDSSHAVVGLMGAGPALSGWNSPYPFVIDSLAKQGLTNSRAFSMDLRGLDSARGSVIFGGIDVKKYSGKLVKVPIIPADESPDGYTRFWVHVNEIKVNQPDGKVVDVYTTPAGSQGQPVLLDSGYTLSALPKTIMDKLLAAFPSAQPIPNAAGKYTVDCLAPDQGGSLDFTFAGTTINVRYYDFVWHLPDSDACVLGAFEDNEFPVLGDTFLRAAYLVYDWDNENVHLAQSDDCGSKLVPIGKGANAVPDLLGECGQTTTSTSTTQSSTSATSTSTTSSTSSTSTETSTTASSTASSTSSTSEQVSSTSTSSGSVSSTASTTESTTSKTSSTSAHTSSTSPVSSTSASSTGSTSTSGSSTHTSSSASTITSTSTDTRTTITYTKTNTYTITSCPPTVTSCPAHGHVTTEIITATETVCPETTGTYTLTKTITCPGHGGDCTPTTQTLTVTVSPVAPSDRTTTHEVPGCTPGAAGPSVCAQCGTGAGPTTLVSKSAGATATAVPTGAVSTTVKCPGGAAGCGGGNGTATATATGAAKPTKVVTAGAASFGVATGVMGVVVGLMAVMAL